MSADPTKYIVAIPGTEQTEELSRKEVLDRLTTGRITTEYWVWSPADQDWKQIADIPGLRVEPHVAPPVKTKATRRSIFGFLRRDNNKANPAPARQKKAGKQRASRTESASDGWTLWIFKALVGAIFLVTAVAVGINYELVDKPFDGSLAKTPFVLVPVHESFGNLFQPDVLSIHVLPNHRLNADNLADFLFTVAASSPPPRIKPFATVQLSPGWQDAYSLSAEDWDDLAKMDGNSSEGRRDFVLDHLDDATGNPLLTPDKLTSAQLAEARQKLWDEVIAAFVPKT
jgi:hypothetical protein